jgi:Uma2 family endonuclease
MTAKVTTLEDLYHVPDHQKAELVHGAIVLMSPTCDDPGYAGDEVFVALREYGKRTKIGRAVGDNKGFKVDLPHRQSFSPDAAFHIGKSAGMQFFEGSPIFAVEVRRAGDYGTRAEIAIAEKRADYFAAGTQVVWDVDLLSEDVVRVYRANQPNHPTIYRRGDLAEAEPAVPGWTMPVNDLFNHESI